MTCMNKIIEDLDELNDKMFIVEMAEICHIGDLIMYIRSNDDGNTPHFHVYRKGDRKNTEVCIMFEEPKYFAHGIYKLHRIDSKTVKELDSKLRTVNPKSFGNPRGEMTYWEQAVSQWNMSTSKKSIPWDLEQPDYTKLNKQ